MLDLACPPVRCTHTNTHTCKTRMMSTAISSSAHLFSGGTRGETHFVFAGLFDRVKHLVVEDHVASRACGGAFARALEVHVDALRESKQVYPHLSPTEDGESLQRQGCAEKGIAPKNGAGRRHRCIYYDFFTIWIRTVLIVLLEDDLDGRRTLELAVAVAVAQRSGPPAR